MVLARLLTPRDFGLFAMVTAVIGYLRVFKDAGLSTATVQREDITQAQVSNLFWINVGLSGAITLLLAASSPLVARFYHEPRLIGVTLTLSATFLLNGLAVQHAALLRRQMRFKALTVIQISSTSIGVVLAIGMALLGYKYWALVVSNLVMVLTMTLFTWLAMPWRPCAPSRQSGTRPLISFGANMASGGFIYSLATGMDGMLIGRYCGAASLGLYSRAAALLRRPAEQFLSPIGSVFLPMLSRVQNQPERYRRTFLQIYEAMALVSCFVTGLIVCARAATHFGCPRSKMGAGFYYFRRLRRGRALHRACHSFNMAFLKSGPRQGMANYEFGLVSYHSRILPDRSSFWSGRGSHRCFNYWDGSRITRALLFCRTTRARHDG